MCQKLLRALLHTIKQPHAAGSGPRTLHRKNGHVIWRWMKWLTWEPAVWEKSQLITDHITFHFPYYRAHYCRVSPFFLLNIHSGADGCLLSTHSLLLLWEETLHFLPTLKKTNEIVSSEANPDESRIAGKSHGFASDYFSPEIIHFLWHTQTSY